MTIPNSNIIIGQNIKTLREKMGLTQEALAQYLETKREYIGYYEIGQRSIPSAQLSKLANLFCMNEYDFYEEDVQNKNINIAFAFRADELKAQDLESIAQFKKIVRNYISMKKALSNE
ncbi:MAG: helix-turn-helix transcriptional regulator [Bacteroidota bacterium]|nr:helix-turn-helix transcriptional regulator [Bacteroidota bacterium]